MAKPTAPRDANQRAKAVVDAVVERTEREEPETHVLRNVPLAPISSVRVPTAQTPG
jgi:hypothetical protein